MILVTGGTGFVGSHLLATLTKEHDKVRALCRNNSDFKSIKEVFSFYYDDITPYFNKIEWVVSSINNVAALEDAFQGVTHVYHVAALISFHPKDEELMRKVNIEGTANIVNFSIAANVQKFCHVSSIAAIETSIKKSYIDEDGEWNSELDKSGYSITKYGAEMEVWRGTQEGLNAVIVNPGIILGAGFWQSGSSKIVRKVAKGMPFYFDGKTGYVAVEDVVQVMIQLMESIIKNERFIVVSENKSFHWVLNTIADLLHKKRPTIKVTKLLSQFAWRAALVTSFFSRKEPLLTKYSARSIHRSYKFSNAKIKKALSFEFTPIEVSIKAICKTFIQQ